MTDFASRIAAASGNAGSLLELAIELAEANARLAERAETLEASEQARKTKQAERTRRHRNVTQRDATLQDVTERDGTLPPPPSPSSSFPTPHITPSSPPSPHLPLQNADFDAEAELLSRIPSSSRPAWAAEIAAAKQGMHGPVMTAEQVQVACRDYHGNGNLSQPSMRHFRAYLAGARRPTRETQPAENAAGKAFAAIRALVTQKQAPGRPVIRFIPRVEVEKLGPRVVTAYENVGGADRFLNPDEQIGFVLRDFEKAFQAATA